jgi:hypothetical protein
VKPKQEWLSEPVSEVAAIKQAYQDATELLVRLANVLENGLLCSARKDGATALGLAGWLLSGLNERDQIGGGVKLIFACSTWVEDDIASRAIGDGACALRMAAQLVNTLSTNSGRAAHVYVQIRDDLICWSDFVEMNVFPHGNNGPEAIRLAVNLLKLTTCMV